MALAMDPFFLREVRQHRRSLLLIQIWWLICLVVLGGLSLLFLAFATGAGPMHQVPATILVALHTCFCVAAGIYGGDRLFGSEHRAGTLGALLLLPITPARWLMRKMLFALWAILQTWLVGIPIYIALMASNRLTLDWLLRVGWIPPLMALGGIIIQFLLPPDFRERAQKLRLAGGARGAARDPDLTVRIFLAWSMGYGMFVGVPRLFIGAGTRSLPLFGAPVPEWAVWLVLGFSWGSAAATSAMANILPTEHYETLGRRTRNTALLVVTGLVLALFWGRLSVPARIGAVVYVIFVLGMMFRSGARPREDRWTPAELAWLESRGAGPLMIRDLRVLLRSYSLRRTVIQGGLVLLAVLILIPYGITYLVRGRLMLVPEPFTWYVDAYIAGITMLVANARAAALWSRDRVSGTFPLLFLTPLGTNQILRDRLWAGALQHAALCAPLFLLGIVAVAFSLRRQDPIAGFCVMVIAALGLAQAMTMGSSWRPLRMSPGKIIRGDWELLIWSILYGLSLMAVFLGTLFVCIFHATRTFGMQDAWFVIWPVAAAALSLLGGLAWLHYRVRRRQMEGVRTGDLPLPD